MNKLSTIEIFSTPDTSTGDFHILTISHDGRQDVKIITKYENVNELMKYAIGEIISEYTAEYE